jgi:hypothetical protein
MHLYDTDARAACAYWKTYAEKAESHLGREITRCNEARYENAILRQRVSMLERLMSRTALISINREAA